MAKSPDIKGKEAQEVKMIVDIAAHQPVPRLYDGTIPYIDRLALLQDLGFHVEGNELALRRGSKGWKLVTDFKDERMKKPYVPETPDGIFQKAAQYRRGRYFEEFRTSLFKANKGNINEIALLEAREEAEKINAQLFAEITIPTNYQEHVQQIVSRMVAYGRLSTVLQTDIQNQRLNPNRIKRIKTRLTKGLGEGYGMLSHFINIVALDANTDTAKIRQDMRDSAETLVEQLIHYNPYAQSTIVDLNNIKNIARKISPIIGRRPMIKAKEPQSPYDTNNGSGTTPQQITIYNPY
jgi:hypothetical protein